MAKWCIIGHMNKKMVMVAVATGVVAFVLGMVVSPKGSNVPAEAPAKKTNSVRIVSVRDNTNPLYTIAMEYPQFDMASDAFNGEIADWVNSELSDFKKNSADNWKGRQDTTPPGQKKEAYPSSPFTFAITWEAKQINENFISVIVRMDSYEGGAHGRQELKTFNYDVAGEKDVTLADLFPGNAGYLGKVSTYARERLIEDPTLSADGGGDIVANMISEGTAPTAENFSNFMFNDDVIDIYFPKYQVAPGVYGEQHVIMARRGI